MCTQSPSKSAPKRGTYKRFDFDCMVIMDIYIKAWRECLWLLDGIWRKPYIPVNYSPTDGWIDQFTQSSGHELHQLPTSRLKHWNDASSMLLPGRHSGRFTGNPARKREPSMYLNFHLERHLFLPNPWYLTIKEWGCSWSRLDGSV